MRIMSNQGSEPATAVQEGSVLRAPSGAPSLPVTAGEIQCRELGAAPGKVASPDAMANPASLDFFVQLARELIPA